MKNVVEPSVATMIHKGSQPVTKNYQYSTGWRGAGPKPVFQVLQPYRGQNYSARSFQTHDNSRTGILFLLQPTESIDIAFAVVNRCIS